MRRPIAQQRGKGKQLYVPFHFSSSSRSKRIIKINYPDSKMFRLFAVPASRSSQARVRQSMNTMAGRLLPSSLPTTQAPGRACRPHRPAFGPQQLHDPCIAATGRTHEAPLPRQRPHAGRNALRAARRPIDTARALPDFAVSSIARNAAPGTVRECSSGKIRNF